MNKRKWWLLLLVPVLALCARALPVAAAGLPQRPANGYYLDQSHLLDNQTKQLITRKNARFKKASHHPVVAVATIKTVGREKPNNYAADLLQEWQLNQSSAMILYTTSAGKPFVHIAVGYQLQSALSNSEASRIAMVNQEAEKTTSRAAMNRVVRKSFKAVSTIVETHDHLAEDKDTLTATQMRAYQGKQGGWLSKIIVLAVILLVVGGLYSLFSTHGRGRTGWALLANLFTGRGGLREKDVAPPPETHEKPPHQP